MFLVIKYNFLNNDQSLIVGLHTLQRYVFSRMIRHESQTKTNNRVLHICRTSICTIWWFSLLQYCSIFSWSLLQSNCRTTL